MSERKVGRVREGITEERRHPPVDAVAGDLCGKAEINAVVVAGADERVGRGEGGFRLSATHRAFDDEQCGLGCAALQRPLERVGTSGKVEHLRELDVRAEGTACPVDGCQALCGTLPRRLDWEAVLQWEEALVRPDPVGNCNQSGEQPKTGEVVAWTRVRE